MSEQRIRPPTAEEVAAIHAKRDLGGKRLGIDPRSPPADIALAADEYVDKQQKERSKYLKGLYLLIFDSPGAIIEEVGAAWGDQLVRASGWEWQFAVRETEVELAVTSPDLAVAVFPSSYLGRMLEPPYAGVTMMLMFNMIAAGKLPEVPAGTLEDISDGRLQHIIPKKR